MSACTHSVRSSCYPLPQGPRPRCSRSGKRRSETWPFSVRPQGCLGSGPRGQERPLRMRPRSWPAGRALKGPLLPGSRGAWRWGGLFDPDPQLQAGCCLVQALKLEQGPLLKDHTSSFQCQVKGSRGHSGGSGCCCSSAWGTSTFQQHSCASVSELSQPPAQRQSG